MVWFGEAVPKIEDAVTMVREADILIVVGTSLAVEKFKPKGKVVRPF